LNSFSISLLIFDRPSSDHRKKLIKLGARGVFSWGKQKAMILSVSKN
jgi:hypothetical protein